MNTPALDKFLTHHERTCTYFIYSGDRHCSCGRDEAVKELQALKAEAEQPKQYALPLFALQAETGA